MAESTKQSRFMQRSGRYWLAVVTLSISLLTALLGYRVSLDWSHAKTNPYQLNMVIEVDQSQRVFMGYDYGAGINDQHIRPLDLSAGRNELTLSLSAWKPVSALYFIAPQANPYKVTELLVDRYDQTLAVGLPSNGATLEGENWITRVPLTVSKN